MTLNGLGVPVELGQGATATLVSRTAGGRGTEGPLPIGTAVRMRAGADPGSGPAPSWGPDPDGKRLWLQHGPIDLVIGADGDSGAVAEAYRRVAASFPHWLGALVEELPRLRQAERPGLGLPTGPIAARMVAAVRRFPGEFVTPMAAVAGAVADEAAALIATLVREAGGITRAYVNNGGDIALLLTPGAALTLGVVPSLRIGSIGATVRIDCSSPVRGVATSGWQGRSHSLGIADAVTVLAASAADADAAATLIANAVDIDHPGIARRPAYELREDSDLGERLVTVGVPALDPEAVDGALEAGLAAAVRLHQCGALYGAALALQGRWRVLGEALGPTLARAVGPRMPAAQTLAGTGA